MVAKNLINKEEIIILIISIMITAFLFASPSIIANKMAKDSVQNGMIILREALK